MPAADRRASQLIAAVIALAVGLGVPSPADAQVSGESSPGWQQLQPETSPQARGLPATAYDRARDQTVLFGGNAGSGGSDDTWVFDGAQWTELDLAVRPGRRSSAAMAYDPIRGEVLLFGGACDCAESWYGDTWVFDGESWQERFPAHSPSERDGARLVFDPATRELVLFGGARGFSAYDDTWVWDGTTWKERRSRHSPPALTRYGMARSRLAGEIVLFGGYDSRGVTSDATWLWDGEDWRQDRRANSPSARSGVAMTSYGRRVVLFGGRDEAADIGLDDTWIYGSRGWRLRAGRPAPQGRCSPGMAYDNSRRAVYLYGGFATPSRILGDTWTFAARARE